MDIPRVFKQFVAWHRRAIAAALAGLSVLLLASQLMPTPPEGRETVVTSRALSSGHVVESADVRIVELPPDAVPEGTPMELDDVVGSTVGVRIAANSVVQAGMLATTTQLEEGRALVPIAIPDEQLTHLLIPGNPVSLVYAGEGFEVVTGDARVAALPAEAESQPLSPGSGRAPLILVDVPSAVAPTVSALGQRGELTVILGTG